jgi:hypothetical protein
VNVRPRWTEKLYRPTAGQDHLGLGSVSSDRILARLSPGINVLTFHPRYWSFYTFLLDEFWRRDLPRTRRSFVAFYRPREAIFAIGAHLCDRPQHDRYGPMRAVVGSEKARGLVARAPADYDPQFHYIESDLGGYGLYYASTIAAMGIIGLASPEAGLQYDAPTPEGRVVADAFRSAIAGTDYYRNYFDDPDKLVPERVVRDYIRAACLCQLQAESAPDRALLRDAYLHAGPEDSPEVRRATLRFVLDLAEQTDGTPIDEDIYRQLIYFRAEPDGSAYEPRAGIERTARRWRLYQAREYYSYALNRLWQHVCSWGLDESIGGSRPVPLEALWAHVDDAVTFTQIAEDFELDDPGFDAHTSIADATTWLTATANIDGTLDDGWDIYAPLQEHWLYLWGREPGEGPETLPGMTALLLLIAARLGSPATATQYENDWDIVIEGGVSRLAMSRFFAQLRRRTMAGETVSDLLRWLLTDYVIRQHERVAVGKLPEDTYRFRRDGDALRFFSQPAFSIMNNSRFDALAMTVHELGFVGALGNDRHALSEDGRRLLEDGDLPEGPIARLTTRPSQVSHD